MNRVRRRKIKKIIEELDRLAKEIESLTNEETQASNNLHYSFIDLSCKLGHNVEILTEVANMIDGASFLLTEEIQ